MGSVGPVDRRQGRTGFAGVWRGGVSLIGVAFAGVAFIGGRSDAVVMWNVMRANLRTQCSGFVTRR